MDNLPIEIVEAVKSFPSYDASTRDLLEPSAHSESDQQFAIIVAYYTQADTLKQEAIAKLMFGKWDFLLFVAWRMAVQTIRTNDPTHIFPGIMALVLEDIHRDYRD